MYFLVVILFGLIVYVAHYLLDSYYSTYICTYTVHHSLGSHYACASLRDRVYLVISLSSLQPLVQYIKVCKIRGTAQS